MIFWFLFGALTKITHKSGADIYPGIRFLQLFGTRTRTLDIQFDPDPVKIFASDTALILYSYASVL